MTHKGVTMVFNLPVIAGVISTTMFGLSMLPMMTKAFRTRDLQSYSLGNLLLSNGGNAIHSVYVFSLPPGPIWLLHSFYLLTTALMLIWYLRYELRPAACRGHVIRGWTALAALIGTATSAPRHESPSVSAADRQASLPGQCQ